MLTSRRTLSVLSLFAALGAASPAAPADTANLVASKDASIFGEAAAQSAANGAGDYIHVGSNSAGDTRRALIRFDVSSIPAGSTITAVTLTIWEEAVSGARPAEVVELHKLTQDWTEGPTNPSSGGGHGAPAVAGDVTWIRRIYNTTSWTNAGGTFSATVSSSLNVSAATGAKTWPTGANIVADVQGWLTTPATNFGWLLKGDESSGASANQTARKLQSRTFPTSGERPKLTVTFTPPAGTGGCCATDGTCTVKTSAQCTAPSTYQGDGTSCSPNTCPQPMGACCSVTNFGFCALTSAAACGAGSTYMGNGTLCTQVAICTLGTGPCCHPNATCTILSHFACTETGSGGVFQNYNGTCAPITCPWVLTPFMDALPIPVVAVPTTGSAGGAAHYDMDIVEFSQQLHSQLPASVVWGYEGLYPGPTIEATRDQPVTVNWINNLHNTGVAGAPLRTTHYLPVDTCLHGPNVTGVVPMTVTHLHGGHLAPSSDGFPDLAFAPGSSSPLYTYPNNQIAATMWYHDHALGLTRLNVYMGLAGFYLLRDPAEAALPLPQGLNEIPLVIQDRSFNVDGSLKYNATFQDHFFGDFTLVNGKVWPYLDVRQGKYRFRMLNGSNTRTYTLALSPAGSGVTMTQIGSDGGLLAAPVPITSITLMPAERIDVVLDFGAFGAGHAPVNLVNSALSPFPGGGDGPDIVNVMQFRATGNAGYTTALPASLVPVPRTPEASAVTTRSFQLTKIFDNTCNHDMWLINNLMWDDIAEFPLLGDTEIWSWVNRSGVSHPMHVHMTALQVLDRQNFSVDGMGNIIPSGAKVLPDTTELGWKDTVQATPNQITRVIVKFEDYAGTFPYHCHILDHEDHEMMRQFTLLCKPLQLSQSPSDAQVNIGQTAGFAAAATGSPSFSYVWRRPPSITPLVNGPTPAGSVISGATTGIIQIANAKFADAGLYRCSITDPCGATVNTINVQLTVYCPADFNHSGGSQTVQDLFDFLAAWFAKSRGGDFNQNGVVTVQDIFDFLQAWFTKCP